MQSVWTSQWYISDPRPLLSETRRVPIGAMSLCNTVVWLCGCGFADGAASSSPKPKVLADCHHISSRRSQWTLGSPWEVSYLSRISSNIHHFWRFRTKIEDKNGIGHNRTHFECTTHLLLSLIYSFSQGPLPMTTSQHQGHWYVHEAFHRGPGWEDSVSSRGWIGATWFRQPDPEMRVE